MALSAAERRKVAELARSINAHNRAERSRRAALMTERLARARSEIERLVVEFRRADPDLRRVALFGSLARDSVRSPEFDIDLAVDSSRYMTLLGIALDSGFKVDLVDLSTASRYIRDAVDRDGVEIYRAG